MTDPSTATAAITAVSFIALLTGHMLGDHPVQTDADAAGKGHPSDTELAAGAHPYTGWGHCLRHVGSYLACQAAALLLAAWVAPLTVTGAIAALTVSGSTHAVIDRRWIVRAIITAKGGCPTWAQAPYFIDQSLHFGAILVAAVLAARATSWPTALLVTTVAAALIPACLIMEHHRAHVLTTRAIPVPATATGQ